MKKLLGIALLSLVVSSVSAQIKPSTLTPSGFGVIPRVGKTQTEFNYDLLSLSKKGSSQKNICKFDSLRNDFIYSEIIESPLSKEQLFRNAKTWVAKNLSNYKKDVTMEDEATGRIIIKINDIDINDENMYSALNFIITIDCKNNKYRYMISDIKHQLDFKPLDTHHVTTMTEYFEANTTEMKAAGIEYDLMFIEICNSIKKEINIKDDF